MKWMGKTAGLELSSEEMLYALRTASVLPTSNAARSVVVYQKVDANENFDDICEAFGLKKLHRYESRGGLLKALKLKSIQMQ